MSTTLTTLITMPTARTATLGAGSTCCCPGCGLALPAPDQAQAELLVAQARIQELDAQVRQLNQKAAAAVDRWAAYEAELSRLRAQQATSTPPPPQPSQQLDPSSAAAATRSSFLQAAPSRLSALLYPRKTGPAASTASTDTSASTTAEGLLEALTREQTLRREAEGRLSATSREVEELSVSLFEQANEMVAEERRARARLEERVGELEKRDVDKRRRLERLEVAMQRIERVRNLLEEE